MLKCYANGNNNVKNILLVNIRTEELKKVLSSVWGSFLFLFWYVLYKINTKLHISYQWHHNKSASFFKIVLSK